MKVSMRIFFLGVFRNRFDRWVNMILIGLELGSTGKDYILILMCNLLMTIIGFVGVVILAL